MRHETVGLHDSHCIAPRLHQGAHVEKYRSHELEDQGFTMVILCAEEWQYRPGNYGPGIEVVNCPLDDASDYFTGDAAGKRWRRVDEAADRAVEELGCGGRVYVSCSMGLNRSGVVVASILRRLWPSESMMRIIAHIQAARFSKQFALPALFNTHFVEKLIKRDAARLVRAGRRSA